MLEEASTWNTLPAKQAIRAVNLLYDLAPPEAWPGGGKLPVARIQKVMERLRDEAPEVAQPLVDGMFDAENLEGRGALARYALEQYATDEKLRPSVERAVKLASQPDMSPVDPSTMMAIVGFLVLVSPRIETDKFKYTGGLVAAIDALHVDKIAEHLPDLVKLIPKGVLAKFGMG